MQFDGINPFAEQPLRLSLFKNPGESIGRKKFPDASLVAAPLEPVAALE